MRSTTSSRQGSAAATTTHEHGWTTESRHPTSEGWVLYVVCGVCGARRVDLQERAEAPPGRISRAVTGDP